LIKARAVEEDLLQEAISSSQAITANSAEEDVLETVLRLR
jgi:hypothetical protein